MLSYQHGYHAGNFADVVKHFTLTRLLSYLMIKEKPIFYLETHAGKGFYDLYSAQSLKTGEASEGIEKLWPQQELLSELFLPYFESIRIENQDADVELRCTQPNLHYYPGSPLFALRQLRPQDRLFACELHPQEFAALRQLQSKRSNMKLHLSHTNGLSQLSALLPPPERRGLIFIDPSYEIKTDYQLIPKEVAAAYRRFNTGIYCIWYPIIEKKWHEELTSGLSRIESASDLRVEFYLPHSDRSGMVGCGLWIINPPYVLAEELNAALPKLSELLSQPPSSFSIESRTR